MGQSSRQSQRVASQQRTRHGTVHSKWPLLDLTRWHCGDINLAETDHLISGSTRQAVERSRWITKSLASSLAFGSGAGIAGYHGRIQEQVGEAQQVVKGHVSLAGAQSSGCSMHCPEYRV